MAVHRRRDVQRRILVEEAERLEPEGDRVCRHDRPVLGPGDVVDAEDVPQHDIGVSQRRIVADPVADPQLVRTEPAAGFGARLGRIVTGRPALGVVVRGDPQRMPDHRGTLVDRRRRVQQGRDRRAGHELVTRMITVLVGPIRIDHLPGPLPFPGEIARRLPLGVDHG